MSKKTTKRLLVLIKCCLAACLLVWVFSQAHWGDYVQAKEDLGGQSWSVVSGPAEGKLHVSRGILWWKTPSQVRPVEEFEPFDEKGNIVRRGLAGTFENIQPVFFAIAVLGFLVSLLIVGYRFWFLLKSQGIRITLWEATRLTFLGQFFNMVVPGTVGGDVVKAWYVSKHTTRTAAVLVTIFLDRMIGLIELVLMAAVMLTVVLVAGLESFERLQMSIITVCIVGAICIAAGAFFLSAGLRRVFRLQKIYQRLPIAHHIKAAGKSVRLFRRRPKALFWAWFTTLISHVCYIGSIALIGLSMDIQTPVYSYFIYLPLIYIIGAVPITPGGVGLIENLYLEFFCAGIAAAASPIIALAMLARLIPVFWGLPGLVVAITGPKLPKADAMQAELDAKEKAEQASP